MTTPNDIITESTKNNRICPQPAKWNDFYNMLPNKTRKGNGWSPSLPLILGAWWDTPKLSKLLRFREHVDWAISHDYNEKAFAFLSAMKEEEWYHFDD